jgi:hypothetical protein
MLTLFSYDDVMEKWRNENQETWQATSTQHFSLEQLTNLFTK